MTNPLAPGWLCVPEDVNALDEGLWPASSARDAQGEFTLAGRSLASLAAEFGTPLYLYDEADARERARRIREAFREAFAPHGAAVHVYYAGKAFLSIDIAKWMTAEGLRIDVSTGGELSVVLAAGVDPGRLGFHGNNKSTVELERAVSVGVGTIIVDSVGEIARVAAAASDAGRVQAVRLRINSGVHASTHEYLATAREDQKFGIPIDQAEAAVTLIRAEDSLEFLGLHSHIGSQIFDAAGFAEAVHRLLALHARLLDSGPVPELNIGGGFGIAYTPADTPTPIEEIAAQLARAVSAECRALDIPVPTIAIEPGRVIVGPAGLAVYTIGEIKDVEVATDGGSAIRRYVSVDGGMSDNVRPALYHADYTALLGRSSAAEPVLARVVGKHCESGDIVIRDGYLPDDVARDDLLAVAATGAYCVSLGSNYNYVQRPAVVAVREGNARVLLRRETEAELLTRDMGLRPAEETIR